MTTKRPRKRRPSVPLDSDIVPDVLHELRRGKLSHKEIAQSYGVTQAWLREVEARNAAPTASDDAQNDGSRIAWREYPAGSGTLEIYDADENMLLAQFEKDDHARFVDSLRHLRKLYAQKASK